MYTQNSREVIFIYLASYLLIKRVGRKVNIYLFFKISAVKTVHKKSKGELDSKLSPHKHHCLLTHSMEETYRPRHSVDPRKGTTSRMGL